MLSFSSETKLKRVKRDAEEMPVVIPGVDASSDDSDNESREKGKKKPEDSKNDSKEKESQSADEEDEEEEEEKKDEDKSAHRKKESSTNRKKTARGKGSRGAHKERGHHSRRHKQKQKRNDRIPDLQDWNDRNWDPHSPPLYGGKRNAEQLSEPLENEKRISKPLNIGRGKRFYQPIPPEDPEGKANEKRSEQLNFGASVMALEERAGRSKRACKRPEDKGRYFYLGSQNDRCRKLCQCGNTPGYANCKPQCLP